MNMKHLKNAKRLNKQDLKKIIGGEDLMVLAQVKCNKLCSVSIPCNKGCTCAGNRCIEDDLISVALHD
jgi:bacteriocin-like protein